MNARAATLAVGTEVTDGQIVDRNSGWISDRLVHAGLEVIEHRAVPDDHAMIERALCELAERADYLFVTGGLGPTSDDFTRDLIAKVFSRPLEYDAGSWQHLSDLLTSRGLAVREIQRQQCYFPQGARVLTNPAGTANAFTFAAGFAGRNVQVYALPGPPAEIAAVWQAHLAAEIEKIVPLEARASLRILRFLGRGESQIAEVVEEIIRGQQVRVGYRASMPYVEVKLWWSEASASAANEVERRIVSELGEWMVGRDADDLADILLDKIGEHQLHVIDQATRGTLQARLLTRIAERSLNVNLRFETLLGSSAEEKRPSGVTAYQIKIEGDEAANLWRLTFAGPGGAIAILEEKPVFNYKVESERGRRYITERLFLRSREIFAGALSR